MEINSAKRDPDRINAGEWVDEIQNMGDLRLKVRGMSSDIFIETRSRKERKVPRGVRHRDGSLPVKIGLRLLGEAMAEALLLDWENVTENGEVIPYSKEKALQFLTDPEFTPFADAVTWAANFVDRGDVAEALAGN